MPEKAACEGIVKPTLKQLANRIRAMPDSELLMVYNLAMGNLQDTLTKLSRRLRSPLPTENKVNKTAS